MNLKENIIQALQIYTAFIIDLVFAGKVIASAEIIKIGKKIASIKGELHNKEGKLATTLIHNAVLVKALPNE